MSESAMRSSESSDAGAADPPAGPSTASETALANVSHDDSLNIYFIVYSPKIWKQKEYEAIDELFDEKILVVNEFGRSGRHKHTNWIIKSGRRIDNIRRQVFEKLNWTKNKNILRLKTVRDEINLENTIAYISKEENREVIFSIYSDEELQKIIADARAREPPKAEKRRHKFNELEFYSFFLKLRQLYKKFDLNIHVEDGLRRWVAMTNICPTTVKERQICKYAMSKLEYWLSKIGRDPEVSDNARRYLGRLARNLLATARNDWRAKNKWRYTEIELQIQERISLAVQFDATEAFLIREDEDHEGIAF